MISNGVPSYLVPQCATQSASAIAGRGRRRYSVGLNAPILDPNI